MFNDTPVNGIGYPKIQFCVDLEAMVTFINWLSERRKLNLGLVIFYFLFLLFFHDPVVYLSFRIMESLTYPVYNLVIGGITIFILLTVSLLYVKNLLKYREAVLLQVGLLVFVLLGAYAHNQVLSVLNIEAIHALEFGILTILFFPLSRRIGYAVFFAGLCGFIDEYFQYQILYPDRESYLDFNDIVMDLLGIGLASIVILNSGVDRKKAGQVKGWFRSPVIQFIAGLLLLIGVLRILNLIAYYGTPENAPAWLILNENVTPNSFWVAFGYTGQDYHILQPTEGFLLTVSLMVLFSIVDLFD